VTLEQGNFIRKWYKIFIKEKGQQAYLSNEHYNALATLIDLDPQTVHNWIGQNLMTPDVGVSPENTIFPPRLDQDAPTQPTLRIPNRPDTQASSEHSQLSKEIIRLINNHVEACNSKRAKTDGRRRVNSGKYECTFNCGYRTKRPFDWKRHEENHQPQNFWLCSICSQGERPSNFLVHRNDKLLKHIQDKHTGSTADDVIKSSEIAYKASFKPRCGFCGHDFEAWEERNKHILQHFDDE
ncbi:hypothetical protein AOQ84DRAFT_255723, partial [Glonium stellatum]